MKAYIVQLQCITNMHVGNGDVNYNIIDNEVERDPVTNYPTINASGVKGALRDFFVGLSEVSDADTNEIFGFEHMGKSSPGKIKILGADMIAVPARASDGDKPYYLVSTSTAVERINEITKLFINKELFLEEKDLSENVEVEGYKPCKMFKFDQKPVYILNDNDFKAIELPVLARNKLDNGISKNLWYEEIVPHDSMFLLPVVADDEKLLNIFKNAVENKIVQFGGNASIGYGLCKVKVYE